MKRLQRWILPIALGAAGLVLLVQYLTSAAQPGQWSYSELVANAQAGRVSEITISGTSGLAIDTSGHKFNVALPADQSVSLADNLKADGVKTVRFATTNDLGTLLIQRTQAGLVEGDVIVRFNGKIPGTRNPMKTLRKMILTCKPGQVVLVEIFRDGKIETKELRIGKRPPLLGN